MTWMDDIDEAVKEYLATAYYVTGTPFIMNHSNWYRIDAGDEVVKWLEESFKHDTDFRYSTEPNSREIFVTEEVFVMLELKFS